MVVAFVDPYNTERPYSGEAVDRVSRDHLSLRERLGYAVLLRAGYLKVRYPARAPRSRAPADAEASEEAEAATNEADRLVTEEQAHSDLECLGYPPSERIRGGGVVNTRALAAAILATEKYNRSSTVERLEVGLAAFKLGATGTLPDYSLGVGQLRPGRAREVLVDELGGLPVSDEELLDLLSYDCQNVRLTGKYVARLIRKHRDAGTPEQVATRAALEYNGASTPSVHGLRYVDAVLGAYTLMDESGEGGRSIDDDESSPSADSVTVTQRSCVRFDMGSTTGSDSVTFMSLQRRDSVRETRPLARTQRAIVVVYLWQTDPGPNSYLAQLAQRRKEWILAALEAEMFQREMIFIIEPDTWGEPLSHCSEAGRGPADSQAVIEVKGGA